MEADGTIRIRPIGTIRSEVFEQRFGGFQEGLTRIELRPELVDYLLGLDEYSHLKVIYWLSEQTESHAIHRPQGNEQVPDVGMFACR
jgi:tRNA (Thr-GGU) A37 N-methylase